MRCGRDNLLLRPAPSAAARPRPGAAAVGRVLAGTVSTGGLIGVEEAVLPPGMPGPYRHYHPHLTKAFYVLEGELLLQIGAQVERVGAGAFAFCPVGCAHALWR